MSKNIMYFLVNDPEVKELREKCYEITGDWYGFNFDDFFDVEQYKDYMRGIIETGVEPYELPSLAKVTSAPGVRERVRSLTDILIRAPEIKELREKCYEITGEWIDFTFDDFSNVGQYKDYLRSIVEKENN